MSADDVAAENRERLRADAAIARAERLRRRAQSEERVLAAVKEWLPRLGVGEAIQVEALDPDASTEGAHFVVSGPNPSPSFVCRRGRPISGADAADNGMGT